MLPIMQIINSYYSSTSSAIDSSEGSGVFLSTLNLKNSGYFMSNITFLPTSFILDFGTSNL